MEAESGTAAAGSKGMGVSAAQQQHSGKRRGWRAGAGRRRVDPAIGCEVSERPAPSLQARAAKITGIAANDLDRPAEWHDNL